RNRSVEAARTRDRELRAERARCAAPCRDHGRKCDLFSGRAPLFGFCEDVVHLVSSLAVEDPIADVLVRVDAGELGDPLPVLAYLAGQSIHLDEAELNGARRRALLLVAAGGDPHRELDVDDRAVKAIAADLHTHVRRDELARSIDELVLRVRDLPA